MIDGGVIDHDRLETTMVIEEGRVVHQSVGIRSTICSRIVMMVGRRGQWAFRKIYKRQGIRGLYTGISLTLIGMLPYNTCYYFMYETAKTAYCRAKKKKALTRAELLVVGAVSGLTASTICFLLEVARKQLMIFRKRN
ncbi:putative mitochondrial adenine nucleotide transporter BTL1 [Wolffia australiana]